jgi:hypothetical protein
VLDRECKLVERLFCTLKNCRAIASRYDKLASIFLTGVLLVSVVVWLDRRQALVKAADHEFVIKGHMSRRFTISTIKSKHCHFVSSGARL